MCIPVLPNTEHPTGRKPLCPIRPLPWPNCYHATGDKVRVYIPTTRGSSKSANRVDFDDMVPYLRFEDEVDTQMHALRMAARSTPQPEVPTSQAHDAERSQSIILKRATSVSRASDYQTEDDEQFGPTADSPLVSVWTYDLLTVESASDPQDYFGELEALKRLSMIFVSAKCRLISSTV